MWFRVMDLSLTLCCKYYTGHDIIIISVNVLLASACRNILMKSEFFAGLLVLYFLQVNHIKFASNVTYLSNASGYKVP